MTSNPNPGRPAPPSFAELTARLLEKAGSASEPPAEVEPHEVIGGFRADARQTWDDATAVFRLLGVDAEPIPCPPEWAAFVGLDARTTAVPLAAGVVPQRVRDLPALLAADASGRGRRVAEPVAGFVALRGWVRKALRSRSAATLLAASGVAAGLGDWADAEAALRAAEPFCTGDWRPVWENQRAAVAWLRGEADPAWPTGTGPVAAFNRGVCRLSAGEPAGADFATAADLPDSSGWCHLANLYRLASRGRG